MRKCISIFIVCIFLLSSLCAGAPALGAPIQPEFFEVPSGLFIFHIDKDGVLAYQYDDSTLPPKTHLLKSKNLTSKFTPIDTFEDASPMISKSAPLPNSPVFIYGRMKGKEKYAIYVLNGRGEVINEIPGTKNYSADPPYIVVPDILSPLTFYVLQALQPPQARAAGYNINLQGILLTSDGGKIFKKVSLPGETPEAIEGIVFNPENTNELWVWRSSMGYWSGVKHSTDGGISWHDLNIDVEGGIYGLMYNPITREVVVSRRNLLSTVDITTIDNKGKTHDIKGNLPSKVDSYARVFSYVRVLFFDKESKSVIIPIFWYENNGNIIGEIYSYSDGKYEKIADIPEVEGEAVHGGFISPTTFFLSFVNFKGNNKVIVYTLNNSETSSKFKTFSMPVLIVLLLCFFAFWMFLKKEAK